MCTFYVDPFYKGIYSIRKSLLNSSSIKGRHLLRRGLVHKKASRKSKHVNNGRKYTKCIQSRKGYNIFPLSDMHFFSQTESVIFNSICSVFPRIPTLALYFIFTANVITCLCGGRKTSPRASILA